MGLFLEENSSAKVAVRPPAVLAATQAAKWRRERTGTRDGARPTDWQKRSHPFSCSTCTPRAPRVEKRRKACLRSALWWAKSACTGAFSPISRTTCATPDSSIGEDDEVMDDEVRSMAAEAGG